MTTLRSAPLKTIWLKTTRRSMKPKINGLE